jgi:hypothetical protein
LKTKDVPILSVKRVRTRSRESLAPLAVVKAGRAELKARLRTLQEPLIAASKP